MPSSSHNPSIETEIQIKFWGSRKKENRAKAIIAFSVNKRDALNNIRRQTMWMYGKRIKMWELYGQYVNTPSMEGIPLS